MTALILLAVRLCRVGGLLSATALAPTEVCTDCPNNDAAASPNDPRVFEASQASKRDARRAGRATELERFSMRWIVHGERVLYDCEWLTLALTDVEIPDGERFEHHVLRMPNKAAGTIVFDVNRGVLLLWRHRFITDSWGWEIPAGRIDPGESPEEAARRETLEETGWEAGPLQPLVSYFPTNGLSDQIFHCFVADGATHVGEPSDPAEAERVEWVTVSELRRITLEGEMHDGLSLTAILFAFAHGKFG